MSSASSAVCCTCVAGAAWPWPGKDGSARCGSVASGGGGRLPRMVRVMIPNRLRAGDKMEGAGAGGCDGAWGGSVKIALVRGAIAGRWAAGGGA